MVYFDSRIFIIGEEYRYAAADYYYHTKVKTDGIITYKQEDFTEGIGVFDIECGRFEAPRPFPWQSDDRLEDNVTWSMVQNPNINPQTEAFVSKNGKMGPYVGGRILFTRMR